MTSDERARPLGSRRVHRTPPHDVEAAAYRLLNFHGSEVENTHTSRRCYISALNAWSFSKSRTHQLSQQGWRFAQRTSAKKRPDCVQRHESGAELQQCSGRANKEEEQKKETTKERKNGRMKETKKGRNEGRKKERKKLFNNLNSFAENPPECNWIEAFLNWFLEGEETLFLFLVTPYCCPRSARSSITTEWDGKTIL